MQREPEVDYSKPCFEVCIDVIKTECFMIRANNEFEAERIAELRFYDEYGNIKVSGMTFEIEYDTAFIAQAGENAEGESII